MSSRFTNPSSSATNPRQSARFDHSTCKSCAALRRVRERSLFDRLPELNSPLTPGVQLVNLSREENGLRLRVELGRNWSRMFAQLPSLGPGLVMTRNEAVILARRTAYPDLTITSNGSKGASGREGLWLDFGQLAAARAIHQRREMGHAFAVEFADLHERTVHRFNLTPESDFDAFFEWVRLHQACAAERLERCDEVEDAPEASLPTTIRTSDPSAVAVILAACCNQGLAISATVNTEGLRHRTTFVPQALVREGHWWFASNDETGLHFSPLHFRAASVVSDAGVPALHCSSENQPRALSIEAAPDADLAAWDAVLQAFA